MKEIKFRAWDKETKKIYEVENIYFQDEYVSLIVGNFNEGNIIKRKLSEVELMQYTGLKDKNEKMIFEGEIMQDKNVSMKGVDEFGEVIFKDGKFQLKIPMVGRDGYNYFDLVNCLDDFEIIGNIYENKELLK